MYSAFNPPPWSLLQRHPPTAQSFLIHIKLPYLHNESPRQLKCNVLCLFTQWLCGWNACWASTTTSLTWNNKNTSTSSNSKSFKTKVKIYRLIPPSSISSQWVGHMMHQIHAVHCWGTFSQRMTVDIGSTTTHTEINWFLRFYIVPWSIEKNMESMERHIHLRIIVPYVIYLPSELSLSIHMSRSKSDLWQWFSVWMLKYIYNLNTGTNRLLSLIYTLE